MRSYAVRLARASASISAAGKILGCCRKGLDVFVDIGAERRDPGLCFDPGRFGVGRGDSAAERVRQHLVDLAAEMVKRPRFVETPHLHRPFDRGP
jgi:hypothetical protein